MSQPPPGQPSDPPRDDQTVRFDRSQLPPPGEWGSKTPAAPAPYPSYPSNPSNPSNPPNPPNPPNAPNRAAAAPAYLGGGAPGAPGAAIAAGPARRSTAGVAIGVLGIGTLGAGLFALPLNDYPGSGVGASFYSIRSLVDALDGRGDAFSGLARVWWLWGAFAAAALAVVLVAVLVAAPAARALGWVLAVIAVAGGVVHGIAMFQSSDYRTVSVTFGRKRIDNFFDHQGSGIWVSLAGFAVLAIGGIVAGLSGRRS